MMKSVIFDLDGTLADTSGDLLNSANACFRDLGLGDLLVKGQDDSVALRGGRAMLTAGFARVEGDWTAEIDAQYPRLLEHYGAALSNETVLYPGVREAVAELSEAGYGLGICTNKPEGLAEALMKDLDFRTPFAALLGADTLPVRKPNPEHLIETVRRIGCDPARTCLIGDTDTDRNTAKAAGVPSVLVTFGPLGEGVRDLNPEAVLSDYADLSSVIAKLNL